MAPWTNHFMQGQLEKVNVMNYEEIAKKVVFLLDSRSKVQQISIMLVQSANRWYSNTFAERLDNEKRNLCDNFINSIIHQFANRTKPIKQIPTKEGLSGIPLIKADLLSVWIYRRLSIGPISVALYNSGNLILQDVLVILQACLDEQYLSSNIAKHLGDSLLLLEFAGRELDKEKPNDFNMIMEQINTTFHSHHEIASKRIMIAQRNVPSYYDRFHILEQKQKNGWQISPYGTQPTSADVLQPDDDESDDDDESEETESMPNTDSLSQTFESCVPTSVDAITNSEINLSPAFPSSGIMNDGSQSVTIPSPWTMYFAKPKVQNHVQSEIMLKQNSDQLAICKGCKQTVDEMLMVKDRQTKPSPSIALERILLPVRIPNTPFALTYPESFEETDKSDSTKTPTLKEFKTMDQIQIQDQFTSFHLSSSTDVSFIQVYFSSDFKIGDAERIIGLFYTSLQIMENAQQHEQINPYETKCSFSEQAVLKNEAGLLANNQFHFSSSNTGSAIQTFQFCHEKEIRIQYSANMTLAKVYTLGQEFNQIIAQSAI